MEYRKKKKKNHLDNSTKNKQKYQKLSTSQNELSYRVLVLVFNATFNNISVILWRLVLLVEGTGVYMIPEFV